MNIDISATIAAAHKVDKLWGTEYWITNRNLFCAKLLKINPGFQCSLHYHVDKTEEFHVLDGIVYLQIGSLVGAKEKTLDCLSLAAGEHHLLIPYIPHRFWSPAGALILELSTHHEDSDTVRLEDSREI